MREIEPNIYKESTVKILDEDRQLVDVLLPELERRGIVIDRNYTIDFRSGIACLTFRCRLGQLVFALHIAYGEITIFHYSGHRHEDLEGTLQLLDDLLSGKALYLENYSTIGPERRWSVQFYRPEWHFSPGTTFEDCLVPSTETRLRVVRHYRGTIFRESWVVGKDIYL